MNKNTITFFVLLFFSEILSSSKPESIDITSFLLPKLYFINSVRNKKMQNIFNNILIQKNSSAGKLPLNSFNCANVDKKNDSYGFIKTRDLAKGIFFSQCKGSLINKLQQNSFYILCKVNNELDEMIKTFQLFPENKKGSRIAQKKIRVSLLNILFLYTHIDKSLLIRENNDKMDQSLSNKLKNLLLNNQIQFSTYELNNIFNSYAKNPNILEDIKNIVEQKYTESVKNECVASVISGGTGYFPDHDNFFAFLKISFQYFIERNPNIVKIINNAIHNAFIEKFNEMGQNNSPETIITQLNDFFNWYKHQEQISTELFNEDGKKVIIKQLTLFLDKYISALTEKNDCIPKNLKLIYNNVSLLSLCDNFITYDENFKKTYDNAIKLTNESLNNSLQNNSIFGQNDKENSLTMKNFEECGEQEKFANFNENVMSILNIFKYINNDILKKNIYQIITDMINDPKFTSDNINLLQILIQFIFDKKNKYKDIYLEKTNEAILKKIENLLNSEYFFKVEESTIKNKSILDATLYIQKLYINDLDSLKKILQLIKYNTNFMQENSPIIIKKITALNNAFQSFFIPKNFTNLTEVQAVTNLIFESKLTLFNDETKNAIKEKIIKECEGDTIITPHNNKCVIHCATQITHLCRQYDKLNNIITKIDENDKEKTFFTKIQLIINKKIQKILCSTKHDEKAPGINKSIKNILDKYESLFTDETKKIIKELEKKLEK